MYNYCWDIETGGYLLLPTKITGVTKEVRPVFAEELRFLEFDKKYGCKLEYTYYADQTPEYLRFLFKPKKNIYSNPIIKRK